MQFESYDELIQLGAEAFTLILGLLYEWIIVHQILLILIKARFPTQQGGGCWLQQLILPQWQETHNLHEYINDINEDFLHFPRLVQLQISRDDIRNEDKGRLHTCNLAWVLMAGSHSCHAAYLGHALIEMHKD